MALRRCAGRARSLVTIPLLGVALLGASRVSPDDGRLPPAEPGFTHRIPERQAGALTGSAFLQTIAGVNGAAREEAVLAQLRQGNLPSFLRKLKPVGLSFRPSRGARIDAVIWVTPDYLAIGADDDFLRIPMGLPAALEVSRSFGFILPTRKMVDAIYRQADVRLAPQTMTPGPRMTSSAYFGRHNRSIEKQLAGRPPGGLISGHKKDLILTRRLIRKPQRVAIYGWHRRAGRPIQPLSTVHGARYADYSHGVRLVSTTVLVNGRPESVFDVLSNPETARVLTYEGAIADAERLMARGR